MAVDLETLAAAGGAAGSVLSLGALGWWLVAPRVRDYVEQLVLDSVRAQRETAHRLGDQLDQLGKALQLQTERSNGHQAELRWHAQRLERLEVVTAGRQPVELLELVDLLEHVRQHRPESPRPEDVADLARVSLPTPTPPED